MLAALLAVLLALEAPCRCAAKQLGYAVLLSEGPDQPNAAGQTVAWGSYHITITGESGMMGCTRCCSAAMPLACCHTYSPSAWVTAPKEGGQQGSPHIAPYMAPACRLSAVPGRLRLV